MCRMHPFGTVREPGEFQVAFSVTRACSIDGRPCKGSHEQAHSMKVVGIPLVLLIVVGPTLLLLLVERRSRRL
jgi:hypothetical protein